MIDWDYGQPYFHGINLNFTNGAFLFHLEKDCSVIGFLLGENEHLFSNVLKTFYNVMVLLRKDFNKLLINYSSHLSKML